ncbi:MAG: hybrid sensor histidine kinase/response regulator [Verrucomicrobiota bacterium]
MRPTASGRRPRIALAEVVRETAKVIEIVLAQASDCEVIRCATPDEALEAIRAERVDLALVDALFPRGASFQLCRELKADPVLAQFPVILTSKLKDRAEMLRGFEAGAVDFIFKPLYASELAARIRVHFELKRQRDLTMAQMIEQRELLQLMCHDVTGPVGAVRSALEMCREKPALFAQVEEAMRQSLDRVLELTGLVREMRACEDGKQELPLQPWPLHALVAQSLEVVHDRLERKSIKIELEMPRSLEVVVEAVSFVNSVMANLLSNAAKFSFSGGAIRVRARALGGRVQLAVEDDGIGMPETLRSRLFAPNEPTSRPGTENEPGTGYGMLLVKKFVEAYGGRVEVESRDIEAGAPDHGTRLLLDLPAAPA